MDCKEKECKCERACYILDKCLFAHPLVEGNRCKMLSILKGCKTEKHKASEILRYFKKESNRKRGRAARAKRLSYKQRFNRRIYDLPSSKDLQEAQKILNRKAP